jgi:oxygen-independent coproporphyrinogen-3 oxidase
VKNLSIYIHIPFCQHRCGYCDFITNTGMDHLIPSYVQALVQEMAVLHRNSELGAEYVVYSIYFGGGTPSLLDPMHVEELLGALGDYFIVSMDCEITLEANPGTVSFESLERYYSSGINRLSLGVQSAHQNELVLLERLHNFDDVKNAVQSARKAQIDNISMDLIYGLPYQNLVDWEASLNTVLNLKPDHLSLYSLTIEDGTPFSKLVSTGKMPVPDPDLAADMYELARNLLSDYGFIHYEISNWANGGNNNKLFVSRHNRQYWCNDPYLGFGAGAHGFISRTRLVNEPNLIRYIRAFKQPADTIFPATPATIETFILDKRQEMKETMMMGLRLIDEGVSAKRFAHRFGVDIQDIFKNEIEKLIAQGLVEWVDEFGERIRLTNYGHLLANQVFVEFI